MGTIYKRGDTYWVKVYQHGKPIYESSKSNKYDDAKTLLQRLEGDVARGVRITSAANHLTAAEAFQSVLDDYAVQRRRSKADTERRISLHLAPFFGTCKLSAVSDDDVRRYVLKRQGEGAKNATINRELAVLSRAYSLAKLPARPEIPHLVERNVRKGFLDAAQFDAVRAKLPAPVYAAVTFAYLTGWRIRSEVLPIEWRQIDFTGRGEVRLDPHSTKNDEPRVFPLTAALRAILEQQRAETDRVQKETGTIIRHVFHRQGKPIKSFRRVWKTACKAAGVPGRIPHDMRRSGVRNMVRAGISESICMALAGHKTRSVFDRYNIVSESDLLDAAAKLDAAVTVDSYKNGYNDRRQASGKALSS
jgi:integrase